MVALNEQFAPNKSKADAKNRVGRFFSLVADCVGSDQPPSRNRIGEKRGYAYETASVDTEFEYGPFGELIREAGAKKDAFNFRFSTKYEDAETGLLYYGFRYYDAETGRWLSRDPIQERGGLNLYGMVGNSPINFIDYLGLRSCEEIQNHRDIIYNVLNSIADQFAAGGICAGSEASKNWAATAENANVALGVGVSLAALGGIAEGTTERYGAQVYRGSSQALSNSLSTVGRVTGGIGIAVDGYQAVDAFSSGDIGGGISNSVSAGLGGFGLAIASSNPATALAAAGGALAIGVAEQAALSYIDRQDRASIESYCNQRNQTFQDGFDKLNELSQEANDGCCN